MYVNKRIRKIERNAHNPTPVQLSSDMIHSCLEHFIDPSFALAAKLLLLLISNKHANILKLIMCFPGIHTYTYICMNQGATHVGIYIFPCPIPRLHFHKPLLRRLKLRNAFICTQSHIIFYINI